MLRPQFLRLSCSSAPHAGQQGMEVHCVIFAANLVKFHDCSDFTTSSLSMTSSRTWLSRAQIGPLRPTFQLMNTTQVRCAWPALAEIIQHCYYRSSCSGKGTWCSGSFNLAMGHLHILESLRRIILLGKPSIKSPTFRSCATVLYSLTNFTRFFQITKSSVNCKIYPSKIAFTQLTSIHIQQYTTGMGIFIRSCLLFKTKQENTCCQLALMMGKSEDCPRK